MWSVLTNGGLGGGARVHHGVGDGEVGGGVSVGVAVATGGGVRWHRSPVALAAVKTGGASCRFSAALSIGLGLGCRWGKRRLQLNLVLSVLTLTSSL
jgi:hypothetical protein